MVRDTFIFVNFLKHKRDIHYDGFTVGIGLFLKPFTTAHLDFHLENTIVYRHATENPDWAKNMLLLKNPQFLPNHCETWSK